MNREDIIHMAKEAGFKKTTISNAWFKFAELVTAAEREACAQFLESTNLGSLPEDTALHYARLLKGFAEGIRARGQA